MSLVDELLSFTFSGDSYDPIKRIQLGLHSFDKAFENASGAVGMPIGTGYEIFGSKSVGKSTFCYSLLAILGNLLQSNIVLADLEGFDPSHLKNILQYNQYKGDIKLVHQGTDEEILSLLENTLDPITKSDKKYILGMLDSVAAISPVAERDGELGEANMGRRALLMAQFSRRLLPTVFPRKSGSENVYFLTNHWYPRIGSRGYQSPGGEVKAFLCGVQIHLKREEEFGDGSYVLTGTVYKNRYGFDDRNFSIFMKAGVGIHKGLTALVDGANLGIVSRSKTIKIGDKSFGYLTNIIKDEWEHDEFFEPFYDALKNHDTPDLSE